METKGLVSCHGDPWVGFLPEMISITEREGLRDGETGPHAMDESWAPADF